MFIIRMFIYFYNKIVKHLLSISRDPKNESEKDVFGKPYDPVGNKVRKKAFFSAKVSVKVTSSSILQSFKKASLVEYMPIWRVYFLWFKSSSEG